MDRKIFLPILCLSDRLLLLDGKRLRWLAAEQPLHQPSVAGIFYPHHRTAL